MSVEDPSKKDMMTIQKGDPDVLKVMTKDEVEAGNATGVEYLNTIADRMKTIMDRSTVKISSPHYNCRSNEDYHGQIHSQDVEQVGR
jgi:hypothetical protein